MKKSKRSAFSKDSEVSRSIKIVAAGLFIPTLVLLMISMFFTIFQVTIYRSILFIYLIPLMWGLWNLFYHSFLKAGSKMKRVDLFMVGCALGFIDAAIEISIVDMPSMINLTGNMKYILLIVLPLAYGLVWTFIMKPLNEVIVKE